jgi:hypothetical protein
MAWTLDKVKLPRYFLLTAISRANKISHVVEATALGLSASNRYTKYALERVLSLCP